MRIAKAYLAGSGATSALVGAAFISFLGLTGLFTVNGFPGGLGDSEGDTVVVAPGAAGAPEAAAPAPAASAPTTTDNGALSDTVSGLDNTVEDTTGTDLPLSETTEPLTDQVDQTVDQTIGGLLGGSN